MKYSIIVGLIVRAAMEDDKDNIKEYSRLLIQNLELDGEREQARIIRENLRGKYRRGKSGDIK